jgi:hypothetical protein
MHLPSTNEETISTFEKWLSQLENICEYGESALTPILLNHHYRFNQLVSLSVSSCSTIHGTEYISCFQYLKNAPALKTLEVRDYIIELHDIEDLLENAPSITTLEFIGIIFEPAENLDSRLPEPPILEALSLKYCLGPFSIVEPWVLYFLKTYVCLRDFTFESDDPANTEEFPEEFPEEPARNIIMALGDRIRSFRINLEIQGYRELEELNRKNERLNSLQFTLDRLGDFQFKGDELVRRCDMFQHLHTHVIHGFNPELFEITKEFTNLKQLTLIFSYKTHDKSIAGYITDTPMSDSIGIALYRKCTSNSIT